MDLVVKNDFGVVDIILEGNIKGIVDGQIIKNTINKAFQEDSRSQINLYIKDSFIITSSVIGFFMKAIKVDRMLLEVKVGNNELYEMLSEMNLIEAMNVKKDYT